LKDIFQFLLAVLRDSAWPRR